MRCTVRMPHDLLFSVWESCSPESRGLPEEAGRKQLLSRILAPTSPGSATSESRENARNRACRERVAISSLQGSLCSTASADIFFQFTFLCVVGVVDRRHHQTMHMCEGNCTVWVLLEQSTSHMCAQMYRNTNSNSESAEHGIRVCGFDDQGCSSLT